MKTIVIELSTKSCRKAIKDLERYSREFNKKLDEICRRVAEVGVAEAMARFAAADGDNTGNGGVRVYPVPMENGYKVVAEGNDVYFIEFGTGNSAGMFYGDSGLPVTIVPVYPGSYSEQNAGMYAKYGYWFYRGELMSSTPVYMPMYYAGKAMREALPRIAKEVLGKA